VDHKTDPDMGIRRVNQLASEWLASVDLDRPFFLFHHVFDVHGPYSPPEGYKDRFAGDGLYDEGRAVFAGGAVNCYRIIPEYIADYQADSEEIPVRMETAPFRRAYDEGILMVDDELDAFFEHLKSIDVYDRAMIILMADHGEAMDEGDYYFGHGILTEQIVHVPLIIRMPGGQNGGRRISQTVQLVDLYPTILDLLDLSVDQRHLHGRSLAPSLQGGEAEPAPAYTSGGIVRQAAVVVDGWKLVEVQPGFDSGGAIFLSYPDLLTLLEEEVLPYLKDPTVTPEFASEYTEEDWNKLVKTSTVVRKLRDGLEETGMTQALFEEIRRDPQFKAFQRFALKALQKPFYELYYLPDDPHQGNDLAADRTDKIVELLPYLQEQRARSEEARTHAMLPTAPVTMSPEDIRRLEAIGYVQGSSEKD